MIDIITDDGYQKILKWWDLGYARSDALALLWTLSENEKFSKTSENFDSETHSVVELSEYLFKEDNIVKYVNICLSLLAVWAITHLIIRAYQDESRYKDMFLTSEDLKNNWIIGEIFAEINRFGYWGIKCRFVLDKPRIAQIFEDSYQKWVTNSMDSLDGRILWDISWQIEKLLEILMDQKKVYGEWSFILASDEIDPRIDTLLCLYHFSKNNSIIFEWSDIDYWRSTQGAPLFYKIRVAQLSHKEMTFYWNNGTLYYGDDIKMNFSKFNEEFLDIFFDLLGVKDMSSKIPLRDIIEEIDPAFQGYDEETQKDQFKKYRDAKDSINSIIFKKANIKDFIGIKDSGIFLTNPSKMRIE